MSHSSWASYWERKFTLQENLGDQLNKRSMLKKMKKSKAAGANDLDPDKIMSEHMESLGVVKPSLFDLLPFQIMRLTKASAVALPSLPSLIYNTIKEQREAQEAIKRQEREEEEAIERREAEKKERKEKLRQRKMAKPQYEEREYSNDAGAKDAAKAAAGDVEKETEEIPPRNARQLWTDDQLAKLCRLMKKFPGGTHDRWERIAEVMERYPWEITKMAANVKGTMFMVRQYAIKS